MLLLLLLQAIHNVILPFSVFLLALDFCVDTKVAASAICYLCLAILPGMIHRRDLVPNFKIWILLVLLEGTSWGAANSTIFIPILVCICLLYSVENADAVACGDTEALIYCSDVGETEEVLQYCSSCYHGLGKSSFMACTIPDLFCCSPFCFDI